MDLRQILTYAALSYAADHPVDRITLLNPRRARSITMSIDFVAIGAGCTSTVEMMQQLIQWMTGLQVSA
jgi:hypothetical protein